MTFKDCSNLARPTFYAIDHSTNTAYVVYPRCKMWKCPECAEYLAYGWALRIKHGILEYKSEGLSDWKMVTITSHEKLKTQKACLSVWPSLWAKLSTRLRRKSKGLKYAMFPEQHKDGRVHFHGLMNTPINTRWLKDNARSCGGGFQADVETLTDTEKAIYYTLKYIGKEQTMAVWPKGFRRVRTSAKWPELPVSDEMVYNDLKWVKWPENGEAGFFSAIDAIMRYHPERRLICPELTSGKKEE